MMLKLTKHARWRAKQMGVPAKQIKAILSAEDLVDYPSRYPGGYRVAIAGNIAVPYSADGYAITVLWAGADGRGLLGQSIRMGTG